MTTHNPMQTLQQTHIQHPTMHDPRWQQVLARDAQADGTFFYSVKTTGVYFLKLYYNFY